jgi:hypothetical protein
MLSVLVQVLPIGQCLSVGIASYGAVLRICVERCVCVGRKSVAVTSSIDATLRFYDLEGMNPEGRKPVAEIEAGHGKYFSPTAVMFRNVGAIWVMSVLSGSEVLRMTAWCPLTHCIGRRVLDRGVESSRRVYMQRYQGRQSQRVECRGTGWIAWRWLPWYNLHRCMRHRLPEA